MTNPFTRPLLVDRHVARLVLRGVANDGGGWLVVGDTGAGASAFLRQLARALPTVEAEGGWLNLPVYLDLSDRDATFTPAEFWDAALAPLESPAATERLGGPIARTHLRPLFRTLASARLRIVLLLDGFEQVVKLPALREVGFLAGLRALTIDRDPDEGAQGVPLVVVDSPLAVVGASRLDTGALDDAVRSIMLGSPFFNHQTRLVLGPLADKELARLLGPAKERFDARDTDFVARASGGIPYAAHELARALWDAKDDGAEGVEARTRAGQVFLERRAPRLETAWTARSAGDRWALLCVALGGLGVQPPGLPGSPPAGVMVSGVLDTGLAVNLAGLAARGVLDLAGPAPVLRMGAWRWWLADQLSGVAGGYGAPMDWLKDRGLGAVPPGAAQALAHRASALGWWRGAAGPIGEDAR